MSLREPWGLPLSQLSSGDMALRRLFPDFMPRLAVLELSPHPTAQGTTDAGLSKRELLVGCGL